MTAPQTPESGRWFVSALALASAIAAADVLTPAWPDFIILVVAGPLLASVRTPPRRTLAVGGWALLLMLAVEASHDPVVPHAAFLARFLCVLLAGALASGAAALRQRREDARRESEAHRPRAVGGDA